MVVVHLPYRTRTHTHQPLSTRLALLYSIKYDWLLGAYSTYNLNNYCYRRIQANEIIIIWSFNTDVGLRDFSILRWVVAACHTIYKLINTFQYLLYRVAYNRIYGRVTCIIMLFISIMQCLTAVRYRLLCDKKLMETYEITNTKYV